MHKFYKEVPTSIWKTLSTCNLPKEEKEYFIKYYDEREDRVAYEVATWNKRHTAFFGSHSINPICAEGWMEIPQ